VYAGASPSRMAAEGLPLDFPLQLLVRWRFTGSGAQLNNYFEVHVQDADSGRDATASYQRDFIAGTDFSKTIANHEGSQQVGTAAYAAPDGQWMWLRMEVLDNQTRLRVWPDGQAEPAGWQRTASGPVFTAPPDVITIFGDATDAAQGLEVDSISILDGCLTGSWVDPFDRVVAAHSGATAGWGTGPLGLWRNSRGPTDGSWEVDGGRGLHTAASAGTTHVALHAESLFGPDPRAQLELLVKWRVDTAPTDNAWSFEAYFSNALGIADDWAGVGIAGFGTDDALVNAGLNYWAPSDWVTSAPGYPRPMHDKDMWLRLFVDEFGVYARVWEDGQPEPVLTGGVVPSVGGRGEHWHTYRLSDGGIPAVVWEYLEIRLSGGADTTLVDSVRLTVP
jgi:hypothetical protein